MLKDRDYDVTAHIFLILSLTCTPKCTRVGEGLRGVVWILSAKSTRCTVNMCDGRRRVLVLTGHAGRVAPISPMLKRRISCGLEILN